jgi:hypothetical protein
MKKISALLMAACGLGFFFGSCSNSKTYAEMKKEEKQAIQRFIDLNDIKVISEKEFLANDTMTDVSKNEYVLFSESGVYMQVIQRGDGSILEDGRYEVLARYYEAQVTSEGALDTLSLNNIMNVSVNPDEFILSVSGSTYTASFSTGMMASYWSSTSVPSGWLVPFKYIKPGRSIAGRSKVKLIVPHSEGTSNAISYVMPCYYDIIYQLGQ